MQLAEAPGEKYEWVARELRQSHFVRLREAVPRR
jgi:hypothetical protein